MNKKYIYETEEHKKFYDFCENCNKPIKQIEIDIGVFGCEYCKRDDNISIYEVLK